VARGTSPLLREKAGRDVAGTIVLAVWHRNAPRRHGSVKLARHGRLYVAERCAGESDDSSGVVDEDVEATEALDGHCTAALIRLDRHVAGQRHPQCRSRLRSSYLRSVEVEQRHRAP
jgi:hypothetical protein